MRRHIPKDQLLPLDPEIEATFRRNNRARRLRELQSNSDMDLVEPRVEDNQRDPRVVENRNQNNRDNLVVGAGNPIQEPVVDDWDRQVEYYSVLKQTTIHEPIVLPPFAGNFELKPIMLQLVSGSPFYGMPSEDPNAHLSNFVSICHNFIREGIPTDVLRLMLFPHSLRDKAKNWLNSLPQGAITSWDDLVSHFLSKYFPPAMTQKLRDEINQFYQYDGESLYDAWERYKDLLRRCPNHGFVPFKQVDCFYEGLLSSSRALIDSGASGKFKRLTNREAFNLFEELAMTNYQWPGERVSNRGRPQKGTIQSVDRFSELAASQSSLETKLDILCKKFDSAQMTAHAVQTPPPLVPISCTTCGGGHHDNLCPFASQVCGSSGGSVEEVQYMGQPYQNQNQVGSSGGYNQQPWRNHPNFRWNNNPNVQNPSQTQQQQATFQQPKQGNLPPPGFNQQAQK